MDTKLKIVERIVIGDTATEPPTVMWKEVGEIEGSRYSTDDRAEKFVVSLQRAGEFRVMEILGRRIVAKSEIVAHVVYDDEETAE